LDQSLAGVLQEMIVLLVLLGNGLRQRIQERRQTSTQAAAADVSPVPTAEPKEAVSHE
jgi:hypothetical protein